MTFIWNSAVALLLVTGALLGLVLPFGKIATQAGVSPLVWSFLLSAGTGTVLLAAMLLRRDPIRLTWERARYYLIAGIISYAIPNLLVFVAIPRLGAGFTGIMFALSPVFTLLMSLALRMKRPSLLGLAGIGTGFAGAMIVATTRGELGAPAAMQWVLLALLIPVSLAAGNIYRTVDWPGDAGPLELAAGSHLGSALFLGLCGLAISGSLDLASLAAVPLPALAQVAASSAMFVFFFRVQQVGGPVYLSQIGYVGAAVGLATGTLLLGERYGFATWVGALVIGLGIAMTTRAQTARTQG